MSTATAVARKGSAPIEKIRDRGVNISIFPNAATREDGSAVTFYNTVIESAYKDKQGAWQSSSSFSKDQLYALRFLIDEALRAIGAAEQNQRSTEE
jgi:hypothetical protein